MINLNFRLKILEYLLLFSICLLFYFHKLSLYLILGISFTISKYVFNINPAISENDILFTSCSLFFFLFYILAKIALFSVLYSNKKNFPCIHIFFNKIFKSISKTIIVLSICLLLDFLLITFSVLQEILVEKLPIYIVIQQPFVEYILFGCGLFLPFFVMSQFINKYTEKSS